MGLIAIGDPVFNLSARDKLIGWDSHDRAERLVSVMDAYVLGALPPYNMLLGGKLIASLVRTRDVYDDFVAAYGSTTGIISGKEKKARLLVVTTSSALGRSSVYNRLKLGEVSYFRPIGFTGGWDTFTSPMSYSPTCAPTSKRRATPPPITDLDRARTGACAPRAPRSRLSVSETPIPVS